MRLRVVHDYNSQRGQYKAGQIIEVSDEFGTWLMRDSVSCFVLADEVQNVAFDAPPVDRVMKRPGRPRRE